MIPSGTYWRHNQAGDLPGAGDKINPVQLRELAQANRGRHGWTYTHKPLRANNVAAIKEANAAGFTVNISANSPSEADTAVDAGAGPVVCIVPPGTAPVSWTPRGRKIVVCPATQREGVTCASCRLCARAARSVIVGFPPHGTGAKRVAAVVADRMGATHE
jgi:hypothetical protein